MNDSIALNKLMHMYETMANRFGKSGWWPADSPFEVMAGAVLTQNTNWSNVEKAIHSLKTAITLNPKSISCLKEEELAQLIYSSGTYRIKAKRLKSLALYIALEFGGDLNRMSAKPIHVLREDLLKIPGLGKETTDSILLYALDKPIFVIDAYTKRLFTRHGFFKESISYDELQDWFMKILPCDTNLYKEFHALIVLTCKSFCGRKPACESCPLAKSLIKHESLKPYACNSTYY